MVTDDNIGFVVSSEYRKRILRLLDQTDFLTPSDMAGELDCGASQVSRTVSDLREQELVTCATPDRHKGRLYRITDDGQEIINKVINNE